VSTSDLGSAEMDPKVVQQAANSTWLQLWGLHEEHPVFGKAVHRPDKVRALPVLGLGCA
jgi:hypothetical protein